MTIINKTKKTKKSISIQSNHSRHRTKTQSGSCNTWPYLPLKIVNALEPLAEYYNVSHKARGLQKPTKSDKGFLPVYRAAGGVPSKFEMEPVRMAKPDGEKWEHHRTDFCNRRFAMIKGKPGYGLYDNKTGLPSVMHVNMLMWACSPDVVWIKKNWKNILKKLEEVKKS